MIVAGGRTGTECADGAAAGASDFDVTDVILYVSEMLVSWLNGTMDKETKDQKSGKADLQERSKNSHNRPRPPRRMYSRST